MKTYSISAETSKRILKNWIVGAKNKKSAVEIFCSKANIGTSKLFNLKIAERLHK